MRKGSRDISNKAFVPADDRSQGKDPIDQKNAKAHCKQLVLSQADLSTSKFAIEDSPGYERHWLGSSSSYSLRSKRAQDK
eukprot:12011163-Ditylum_brightwellii.AAC.1